MTWKKAFLICVCSSVFNAFAQTDGTLSVTLTTSQAGGVYAPKNIVAVWVEDSSGLFVKTLLAYAASRITHLNIWEASTAAVGSTFNVTDAITGATRSTHATYSCSWNGRNYLGQLMPDGIYKLRMELTDKNATGNYSTFNFNKGPVNESTNPSNVPSFSSIQINWMPLATTITDQVTNNEILVVPNPSYGVFHVAAPNVQHISVFNSLGKLEIQTMQELVDLTAYPKGLYIMQIRTLNGTKTHRIVKQ